MKAYLRYRFLNDFGGVCSPECNVIFDLYGTHAYTAVNEFIYRWNLNTLQITDKLCYINNDSESLSLPAYCTLLCQHPLQNNCIACGHGDGSVRLWEVSLRNITATFHGHKSAITAVLFTLDGHFLVTGSRDTDIVVWDVSGLTGLFRLRGHQSGITALCLVHVPLLSAICDQYETSDKSETKTSKRSKKKRKIADSTDRNWHSSATESKIINVVELSRETPFLVSGSKDGSVRIWDLVTQHCLQTLFDTSGEICSLMVDPSKGYLFAGSGDSQYKMFKINYNVNENSLDENPTRDIAVCCGTIRRETKKYQIRKIIQFIDTQQVVQALFDPSLCLKSNELADTPRVGTDQGSLLLSNNSHVTFNNIRRIHLLISLQRHRAIKVYRQYPENDVKTRLRRKKNKIKQLLKKKNQQLSELNTHAVEKTAFPSVVSEEKKSLEMQLDTLQLQLQSLKLDSTDEQLERIKSQFLDSESFEHIYTFYLPQKPVSADATFSSTPSLILTYSNNSIALYTIDVHSLLTKKRQDLMDPKQPENENLFKLQHCIENYGHVSCPKDIAVSQDDSTIATIAEHYLYIWHFDTLKLTRCISLSPHQLMYAVFSPDSNIVVAATKEGSLLGIDVAVGTIVHEVESKTLSRISCFTEHPKHSGFVVCRANKHLEFYQYHLKKKKNNKFSLLTWHEIPESATCMQYTPDGRLLVIALMDFTLHVLYSDTLNLFLTLYGHQLPCTSLTISSDSLLLVTGSHDKTMKVWNLQFGNIETSILAHDGVVTQVAFLKDTHQIASTGTDCVVKLWDIDRRDLICQFLGHIKPILLLRLSRADSDRIITASGDRVLRVLERTEEQIFPEEEREKMLEMMVEKETGRADVPIGGKEVVMVRPTCKTVESIRSTEQLMQAIELAHLSQKLIKTYHKDLDAWEQQIKEQKTNDDIRTKHQSDGSFSKNPLLPPRPEQPELSLLLMGLSPVHYLYAVILKSVSPSLLHEIVVALPFSFAEKLLELMCEIFRLMDDAVPDSIGLYGVELLARLTLLTVHTHLRQLIASMRNQQLLLRLHQFLQTILLREKSHIEFSQAAMTILEKKATESTELFQRC